jgi:hypothetical protein
MFPSRFVINKHFPRGGFPRGVYLDNGTWDRVVSLDSFDGNDICGAQNSLPPLIRGSTYTLPAANKVMIVRP